MTALSTEEELRRDLGLATRALERMNARYSAIVIERNIYREYYEADVSQTAAELEHEHAVAEAGSHTPEEIVALAQANVAANERYMRARDAVLNGRPVDPEHARPEPWTGLMGMPEIDRLRADLAYARSSAEAWTNAAVFRMRERDVARNTLADVQIKLNAATSLYEDEKKAREALQKKYDELKQTAGVGDLFEAVCQERDDAVNALKDLEKAYRALEEELRRAKGTK